MSTITDDLRSRCDQLSDAAADEIDALEQAYASLYKSFGQQRTELDTAEARLAEAERLLKFVNDLMSESSGVYGFHLNGDLERWQYWPETDEIDRFIRPADSAPAVQPCGHPWKAQHDFKCILCSSAGPAL